MPSSRPRSMGRYHRSTMHQARGRDDPPRARAARLPLKPTILSPNSSALSMIPVRLPGQAGLASDMGIEINLGATRHRGEEKDLAAITRVNTRKNKGNSVPAKMLPGAAGRGSKLEDERAEGVCSMRGSPGRQRRARRLIS